MVNTVNGTYKGKPTYTPFCCFADFSFNWFNGISMAMPLELPLPELVAEDFNHSWNLWLLPKNGMQRNTVLPTLLRGKLIDYYVELDDGIKNNLAL